MMRRPPVKPSPGTSGIALLLMLLMLALTFSPSASALHVRGNAPSAPQRHEDHNPAMRSATRAAMRGGIRRENGIVTDDDGIIGNGTHGADRARVGHRAHHHLRRTMSAATARLSSDTLVPDTPPNDIPPFGPPQGFNAHGARPRGRDLIDPPATDTENGTASHEADNTQDGGVDDGHAADGHVDDGGADGTTDGSAETAEGGNASARSIVPWVIGSVLILAAVLTVLALMPKKGRSH